MTSDKMICMADQGINGDVFALKVSDFCGNGFLKRVNDAAMDADTLRDYIISAWRHRKISASEALDWLCIQDMLDDDTLMLGYAAAVTARKSCPLLPPSEPSPCAPGGIQAPARELLEAIATGRAA